MFCSKVCRDTAIYRDVLLGRLPHQRCIEKGNMSVRSDTDQQSIVSQVQSALVHDREVPAGDEEPHVEELAVDDCEVPPVDELSVEELAAFIGPVKDPRVRARVEVGRSRQTKLTAPEQTMSRLHWLLYNKKGEQA